MLSANVANLVFFIITVLVSIIYSWYFYKKQKTGHIIQLILTLIFVFLISVLLGQNKYYDYYSLLAIEASIALISSMLITFYVSKPKVFLLFLIFLLFGLLIYYLDYRINLLSAGMFSIGTIVGLTYREKTTKNDNGPYKKERSKEISRDLVQIILGLSLVIILLLFAFHKALYVTFGLIILGYLVNDLLSMKRLNFIYRRIVKRLERSDAIYGLGSIYLAAGAALLIGFIGNLRFLLFAIAVLFFADSIATIAGISFGKLRIPYNKNKTFIGSLAFFAISATLGYLTIGISALALGFLLTVIESLDIFLDDNIRTSITLVVLYLIIFL